MIDEETKATLAWMDSLCDAAILEARSGNTVPASRLGSNPITAFYFHNHSLKTISPERFALDYPAEMKELTRQRKFQEQAQQGAEMAGKVKLLEDQNAELSGKIDALSAKLDALIAAQAPKSRKPKAESVQEPEPEGDEPPAAPSDEGDNPESDGE